MFIGWFERKDGEPEYFSSAKKQDVIDWFDTHADRLKRTVLISEIITQASPNMRVATRI